MDEFPATDEQHLRALEEIRAQIGDMFQRDAEFSSKAPHLIILLDWPLHGQPDYLAEKSNQVAIRFTRRWLDEFISSGEGGHIEMLAQVRAAVSARMHDFEEGRELTSAHEASADAFEIRLS